MIERDRSLESPGGIDAWQFFKDLPWTRIILVAILGYIVYFVGDLLPRKVRFILYVPVLIIAGITFWDIWDLYKEMSEAGGKQCNILKTPAVPLGVGYEAAFDKSWFRKRAQIRVKYKQAREQATIWGGVHVNWKALDAKLINFEIPKQSHAKTGYCKEKTWIEVYNLYHDDEVKINVEYTDTLKLWFTHWIRVWVPVPKNAVLPPEYEKYLYLCECEGLKWFDRQRSPERPCHTSCALPDGCPTDCKANKHRGFF